MKTDTNPDEQNQTTKPSPVGCSDLLALLHIQPRKGGHIVIEGHPDDEEEYLHMSEVEKIIKHLSSDQDKTRQINIMKPETDASTKRVMQNGISPLIDYCYSNDMENMERERNALLLAVKAASAVIEDFMEFAKWQEKEGNIDGVCDPSMTMDLAENILENARLEGYVINDVELANPA